MNHQSQALKDFDRALENLCNFVATEKVKAESMAARRTIKKWKTAEEAVIAKQVYSS